MNFSFKLPAIFGALALSASTAFAAETPAEAPSLSVPGIQAEESAPAVSNPFDPSTWFPGAAHTAMGQPEPVNMAHPAFWMSWIDPETHTKRHMQFMNPAMYAQFMGPAPYMQFANPANWLAWFDLSNYEVLVEGDTYLYWANPASYMHAVDPAMYMQSMDANNYAPYLNPMTYLQFMNPAAYTMAFAPQAGSDLAEANPFNMFAEMFQMSAAE